jgi:hypothetical protein
MFGGVSLVGVVVAEWCCNARLVRACFSRTLEPLGVCGGVMGELLLAPLGVLGEVPPVRPCCDCCEPPNLEDKLEIHDPRRSDDLDELSEPVEDVDWLDSDRPRPPGRFRGFFDGVVMGAVDVEVGIGWSGMDVTCVEELVDFSGSAGVLVAAGGTGGARNGGGWTGGAPRDDDFGSASFLEPRDMGAWRR